jgi:hypothetical protein
VAGGDTVQTVNVETCPAADATGVGTNSWIRVEVPGGIESSRQPVLAVTCGGVRVAGQPMVDGRYAAFVPDAPLPENASCEVSLGEGLVNASGIPVESAAWRFTTGDVPQTSFAWSPPRSIAAGGALRIVSDGDDLIAFWATPSLVLAVSRNNGETFGAPIRLETPGESPYIYPVMVGLSGGAAHVAWRSLPVNSFGFAYYTRLRCYQRGMPRNPLGRAG